MLIEKIKKYKKSSIALGLFFLLILIVLILSRGKVYPEEELSYGITFSKIEAKKLGLDWKESYLNILDDLEIEKIRLVAYWNKIEENKNEYNYENIDWQVEEASKRNIDIILSVGQRLPRWPECHIPDWGEELPREEKQEHILDYIEKTIKRYQDNENIWAWQVENEPFLSHYFGECPKLDKEFLDRELELVRNLDSRPVIVTDSGEISLWIPAARRADIFGTTMYKETYSGQLNMYINYPIRPGFFHFKRNITSWFASPDDWLVIELQAEPWGHKAYHKISLEDRERTMSPEKFDNMMEFARKSGFREFYLWGAEYWYWEKEKNNNPEMWERAENLFTQ